LAADVEADVADGRSACEQNCLATKPRRPPETGFLRKTRFLKSPVANQPGFQNAKVRSNRGAR
jgi:hypothetical protein